MIGKIIASLIVGSALFVGVNSKETKQIENVELQKAINYAPIIQVEFQATKQDELTNIQDDTDVITLSSIKHAPNTLEVGKTYTVRFKNDYAIDIK